MILTAYPKINLGLDILFRRADGFHEIDTLMLPFRGVCDTLEIVPTIDGAVSLQVDGMTIDCAANRNLVIKAWLLMRDRYDIGGVHITLDKRIPFGAGLGGGSADAAATLVALNEIFSLGLSTARLEELAAELGSDVPFFITSQPMFCRGRGEILTRAHNPAEGLWCVVSKPSFGIPTAQAYAGVKPATPSAPLAERLQLPRNEWQQAIINDFEKSLFEEYMELKNIRRALLNSGAMYVSMSGSGSAMYGLYDHKPDYRPIFKDEEVFVAQL